MSNYIGNTLYTFLTAALVSARIGSTSPIFAITTKISLYPVKWHFYGTSHGKGPCDGLGGNVKRLAAKASLQATVTNSIQTQSRNSTFSGRREVSMALGFRSSASKKSSMPKRCSEKDFGSLCYSRDTFSSRRCLYFGYSVLVFR